MYISTRHKVAHFCLTAALIACWSAVVTADDAPEEVWQVIRLSGQQIGYSRSTERTIEEDGRTLLVTESLQKMTVRRFGEALEMETQQTFVETEDGQLVRFAMVMDNPPNSHLEASGAFDNDVLRISTTVLDTVSETELEGMAGVYTPLALDRSLEEDPLEEGETRTQRVFFPEYNQAIELTVTAVGVEPITLYDGSTVDAMHLSMPLPLFPGVIVDSHLVEGKGLLLSRTSLLDMEMEVVPSEIALADVEGTELDVVTQSLVPVQGLEDPHGAERIVYRISTTLSSAAEGFVDEGTQEVHEIDEHTIELTVHRADPEEEPDTETEPPSDEFLQASSFLDCDDATIQELALEGAGDLESPTEIAIALEKFVHDRLTTKDFSTGLARASEVARTLAGDCTEHAVLLAAMLRVKEIPSRVCIGLVYADSLAAFGGHMWTEAWLNGQWVPLDATLGAGGIGAGHLKLAHSSLTEDAPSPLSLFGPVALMTGQLEIEVIEVEQ